MAKRQGRPRRYAALHKFKLKPFPAAVYPVPSEAMPRVLDVSSLNLAVFGPPIFFCAIGAALQDKIDQPMRIPA